MKNTCTHACNRKVYKYNWNKIYNYTLHFYYDIYYGGSIEVSFVYG